MRGCDGNIGIMNGSGNDSQGVCILRKTEIGAYFVNNDKPDRRSGHSNSYFQGDRDTGWAPPSDFRRSSRVGSYRSSMPVGGGQGQGQGPQSEYRRSIQYVSTEEDVPTNFNHGMNTTRVPSSSRNSPYRSQNLENSGGAFRPEAPWNDTSGFGDDSTSGNVYEGTMVRVQVPNKYSENIAPPTALMSGRPVNTSVNYYRTNQQQQMMTSFQQEMTPMRSFRRMQETDGLYNYEIYGGAVTRDVHERINDWLEKCNKHQQPLNDIEMPSCHIKSNVDAHHRQILNQPPVSVIPKSAHSTINQSHVVNHTNQMPREHRIVAGLENSRTNNTVNTRLRNEHGHYTTDKHSFHGFKERVSLSKQVVHQRNFQTYLTSDMSKTSSEWSSENLSFSDTSSYCTDFTPFEFDEFLIEQQQQHRNNIALQQSNNHHQTSSVHHEFQSEFEIVKKNDVAKSRNNNNNNSAFVSQVSVEDDKIRSLQWNDKRVKKRSSEPVHDDVIVDDRHSNKNVVKQEIWNNSLRNTSKDKDRSDKSKSSKDQRDSLPSSRVPHVATIVLCNDKEPPSEPRRQQQQQQHHHYQRHHSTEQEIGCSVEETISKQKRNSIERKRDKDKEDMRKSRYVQNQSPKKETRYSTEKNFTRIDSSLSAKVEAAYKKGSVKEKTTATRIKQPFDSRIEDEDEGEIYRSGSLAIRIRPNRPQLMNQRKQSSPEIKMDHRDKGSWSGSSETIDDDSESNADERLERLDDREDGASSGSSSSASDAEAEEEDKSDESEVPDLFTKMLIKADLPGRRSISSKHEHTVKASIQKIIRTRFMKPIYVIDGSKSADGKVAQLLSDHVIEDAYDERHRTIVDDTTKEDVVVNDERDSEFGGYAEDDLDDVFTEEKEEIGRRNVSPKKTVSNHPKKSNSRDYNKIASDMYVAEDDDVSRHNYNNSSKRTSQEFSRMSSLEIPVTKESVKKDYDRATPIDNSTGKRPTTFFAKNCKIDDVSRLSNDRRSKNFARNDSETDFCKNTIKDDTSKEFDDFALYSDDRLNVLDATLFLGSTELKSNYRFLQEIHSSKSVVSDRDEQRKVFDNSSDQQQHFINFISSTLDVAAEYVSNKGVVNRDVAETTDVIKDDSKQLLSSLLRQNKRCNSSTDRDNVDIVGYGSQSLSSILLSSEANAIDAERRRSSALLSSRCNDLDVVSCKEELDRSMFISAAEESQKIDRQNLKKSVVDDDDGERTFTSDDRFLTSLLQNQSSLDLPEFEDFIAPDPRPKVHNSYFTVRSERVDFDDDVELSKSPSSLLTRTSEEKMIEDASDDESISKFIDFFSVKPPKMFELSRSSVEVKDSLKTRKNDLLNADDNSSRYETKNSISEKEKNYEDDGEISIVPPPTLPTSLQNSNNMKRPTFTRDITGGQDFDSDSVLTKNRNERHLIKMDNSDFNPLILSTNQKEEVGRDEDVCDEDEDAEMSGSSLLEPPVSFTDFIITL